MIQIFPDDLTALDDFTNDHPLRVRLAYARADNLLLGEKIYRENAKLWAHKDMANIALRAAQVLHENHGLFLIVYDCLRPFEAQQKMLETRRVKDNPHWLDEPRLLSPPGTGGHPRGMAIDVSVETPEGVLIDMGTPFDYLADNASAEQNPAHRNYPYLSAEVKANRKILDDAMYSAAKELGIDLIGLPQEWWDYRFPADITNQYAPIHDADLPEEMRISLV